MQGLISRGGDDRRFLLFKMAHPPETSIVVRLAACAICTAAINPDERAMSVDEMSVLCQAAIASTSSSGMSRIM